MRIDLSKCSIRSWLITDAESLAKHADNRKIWNNLREDFPDSLDSFASEILQRMITAVPETWFAIDVGGEAVGMIGVHLAQGPFRLSGELGYWIGEPYWGRGIATEAVRGFTDYAMAQYQLCRIFAFLFESNPTSMRVLEKCGYVKEGVLRQSLVKEDCIIDQVIYAQVIARND